MGNKPEDLPFLISLIKIVNRHPCLWNYTLEDYSKADVVSLTWKAIAIELKDTEQNCRERWTNIRCAFVRSLKPKSGSGNKSKRAYYLANHLSFLIPYLKRNSIISGNLTTHSSEESESIYVDPGQLHTIETCKLDSLNDVTIPVVANDPLSNDESSDFIEQSPTQKRNKIDSKENDADLAIIEWLNTKKQIEEDADLLFFRSLLPDFKKLDDRRKRNVKSKFISLLNSTLDEAELRATRSCSPYSIVSNTSSCVSATNLQFS